MSGTTVSIIIVNYRNWQDTLACLDSLSQQTYPIYRVLVVDNNSPNDSWEQFHRWALENGSVTFFKDTELINCDRFLFQQKITFIRSSVNAGFAAGNNLALNHLLKFAPRDELTWLLNPDVIPDTEALNQLVASYHAVKEPILVGAQVRSFYDKNKLLTYGGGYVQKISGTVKFILNPIAISKLEYISGGCLLCSLQLWHQLGLLPEGYFLYWEETDWCTRARRQGVRLTVALPALVYDKGGTTIGRGYLAEYFYSRNSLAYLKKFYPYCIPSTLLLNFLRIIKRLILKDSARAKAIIKAMVDFLLSRRWQPPGGQLHLPH